MSPVVVPVILVEAESLWDPPTSRPTQQGIHLLQVPSEARKASAQEGVWDLLHRSFHKHHGKDPLHRHPLYARWRMERGWRPQSGVAESW